MIGRDFTDLREEKRDGGRQRKLDERDRGRETDRDSRKRE